MRAAAPFLKWVGGKSKLLKELHARMPKRWEGYLEPFVGGGAMFFSREHGGPVTLGDTNAALIRTYRAVAQDVDGVVAALEFHKQAHAREQYYYEVRDMWNDGAWLESPIAEAAAFIYLNKTGFNGLWRVNKDGQFNVPKGDYVNPAVYDLETMRSAARALQSATLTIGEFAATAQTARPEDFVYFDPPYDPVSKTSNFTSYTKSAFGKEQQQQLAKVARDLRDRGVHVMLSNNDTPFVRSLYDDFFIDVVQCGRAINSKGDKRGKVDEVVVTSYPVHS